jgi:hypothetical protein
MRKSPRLVTIVVVAIVIGLLISVPALAKGGGGHEPTAVNNLSFPALALDGFGITPLGSSFLVPYTGTFPGLTQAEIGALEAAGPWYPQKTEGNSWQAEYSSLETVAVTAIDWGDNVESVGPSVRRPFRLEVVLFRKLETAMTAYEMAVLEYPSSTSELQGTNTSTYESGFATVISTRPKLVIQYLGASQPSALVWDASATKWVYEDGTSPRIVSVAFAPELNVAGRYIFGASQGGWKPDAAGYYRITFYIPGTSGIDLSSAVIGNYEDGAIVPPTGEGGAGVPIVDGENNLTYVDVLAAAGGGGGRR